MRIRIGNKKKKKPSALSEWMDGFSENQLLRDNLNYIVFLSLLVLFYIFNAHMSYTNFRLIEGEKKELQKLRWEYQALESEFLKKSRVASVREAVSPMGLDLIDDKIFKVPDEREN